MPNRPIGNHRPPLPALPDGRPAPALRPRPGLENLRRAAGLDVPARPANPGPDHPRQGRVAPGPLPPATPNRPGSEGHPSPAASPASSGSTPYSLTRSPDPFFLAEAAPPASRSASPVTPSAGTAYVHPGEGDRPTRRLQSPPPPALGSAASDETLSTLPSLRTGSSSSSAPGSTPGTPTGGDYTYENQHFQPAWLTHRNLAGMTEPPRVHHPRSPTPTPPSSPDHYAFPDLAGDN